MTTGMKVTIVVAAIFVFGGVYWVMNVPSKKTDIPLEKKQTEPVAPSKPNRNTRGASPASDTNRAPTTHSGTGQPSGATHTPPVTPRTEPPKSESDSTKPTKPDPAQIDLPKRTEPQLPPLNTPHSGEATGGAAPPTSHPAEPPKTPTSSDSGGGGATPRTPVNGGTEPLTNPSPGTVNPPTSGGGLNSNPPRTEPGSGGTPITPPGSGGTPMPKPTTVEPTNTPPPRTTPTGRPSARNYVIAAGDTLSEIALREYGDKKYWPKIKAANPTIDPNKVSVGTQISLPPKEEVLGPAADPPSAARGGNAAPQTPTEIEEPPDVRIEREKERAAAEARAKNAGTPPAKPTTFGSTDNGNSTTPTKPAGGTYVVARGDTLIRIARTLLKDEKRWREIYNLNKDRIKDPNNLIEGTALKLPGASTKVSTPAASTKPASGKSAGAKPSAKPARAKP